MGKVTNMPRWCHRRARLISDHVLVLRKTWGDPSCRRGSVGYSVDACGYRGVRGCGQKADYVKHCF